MGWARSAWIAIALLALAAGNATAAEPKRVLLLHSFGSNFEAEEVFAGYLRTDLTEKLAYPLDRYEVSLEIARFPDGERDVGFVDYLRALFAGHPPDVILRAFLPGANCRIPRSDVVAACLDFHSSGPRNFSGRGLVILRGYGRRPFVRFRILTRLGPPWDAPSRNQARTSGRLNAGASTMVRDIEETGGVRWHGEASARLQVAHWALWLHSAPLELLSPAQLQNSI